MLYLYKNPENLSQATFERALALLPAERRDAILRHRQPVDRRRMLVASLLLIAGLRGEYDAAGIPDIRLSAKGKPELAAGFPYFSISHSGDYVGCVLADAPVGLDIQRITPVSAARSAGYAPVKSRRPWPRRSSSAPCGPKRRASPS